MRPHLVFIFAFALFLPTTSHITEVGENFAVGAKSIYAAVLVSPQQGALYTDHPPTDEERSGDRGGGCCDPHATSRTFFVLAFIFTVLAIFILRAGSGGLTWVSALPIGFSSIAAGLIILGAVSLFSPSGGGAFADHPPTDEERSGDDDDGDEDVIEWGACNTHHTVAFGLAVLAFILTGLAIYLMRNNGNDTFARYSLIGAAILDLIVAGLLLF